MTNTLKHWTFLLFLTTFISCSSADLNRVLGTIGEGGLTTAQIASGLKQALEIGIKEGATKLSGLDGYYKSPYKIFLPEEAQKVVDKLSFVPGWNNVEAEITKKLNRAAEDAAKSAAPIFVDAITSMSFDDALNILMGEQNAATNYLNKRTYDALYRAFQPVILESLNKFGALDYWADAVNTYNKIPFVNKLNPRIDDYVANKALDGLFGMVAKKELKIRSDVSARTTDLLRKVFAKQD